MERDDRIWVEQAQSLYRMAFGDLTRKWSRLEEVEDAYPADELREGLLDVKQAVIEGNQGWAERASLDVVGLWHELQARYPEEP